MGNNTWSAFTARVARLGVEICPNLATLGCISEFWDKGHEAQGDHQHCRASSDPHNYNQAYNKNKNKIISLD